MSENNLPQSRDEILAALEGAHREVADYFRSLDAEVLFQRPEDGVWSPAENLVHLIKSVNAVTSGLKLPGLALTVLFGTTKRGSRDYTEMVEVYSSRLEGGAKSTQRFVPQDLAPADEERDAVRSRILGGWDRAGQGILRGTRRWKEKGLDKYRLPHPVLGKLTLREMLFFTHYHDLLHVKIVRERLALRRTPA